MPLPTRRIGKDSVSEIGFGAMGLSAFYGGVPSDEERLKILDTVFAEGCTFWDTADIYGDSEALLGKWFQRSGRRNQIFLSTKFGFTVEGANNTPEYMRSRITNSLKLLRTNRIDLYFAHRVNRETPIEQTIRAMAELIKEGKVRYLGLSEVSADTLRRAHAVHPIAAVQVEYSPLTLDIEQIGLLQACRELGVAVIAYSPLGRGMLTGAIRKNSDFDADDLRRYIPKYSQENFPKLLEVIDFLAELGNKHQATPGQITLAWLLAQGPDIIPIPGTKNVKYLRENLGATKIKLSAKEVVAIRKLVEKADLGGYERYPVGFNDDLHVDTVMELN
ncbi:NADP-dependent oxidoreductase domain-containing protein [Crepidotus variabilis]|uniref:NADP-dependent oxidoreductase domain-containing protein n=1 Tax=Crepidotus variabilis TaxID=179855 RepID=A0A9P6EEW9_9AGAR|nr:NADP-dependent oxidoreductase domain-containing protein [Crepidotus variabilis]